MAFSLACENLVCSIKEFIPWFGKKETENQKDLVQVSCISECSLKKCFFKSMEIPFGGFSLLNQHTLLMTHSYLMLVKELRYLLSAHVRIKQFVIDMKCICSIFQFALHYRHIYIHIHTLKLLQQKESKPKALQTALIHHILTKRIGFRRKCKMQNQITKKYWTNSIINITT